MAFSRVMSFVEDKHTDVAVELQVRYDICQTCQCIRMSQHTMSKGLEQDLSSGYNERIVGNDVTPQ